MVFHSLNRNFGFAELTSARKNPNKIGPLVLFCIIPTMKCLHFFVLMLQNLVFHSLNRNFAPKSFLGK